MNPILKKIEKGKLNAWFFPVANSEITDTSDCSDYTN